MPLEKLNCWQYMKCGREPDGAKSKELGICPAAADTSYKGLNHGENAGRLCWAVAGTFCDGKVQGSFVEKRQTCLQCDFYKKVREEEDKSDSNTKFLKYITEHAKTSFLNQLTYKYVKAGERFLVQGEIGEQAYIIQSGTCLTIVEKDGSFYPVCHRGKGDIVGIRSFLTGEPLNAHIEAETDMKFWVLSKTQFDNLSRKDPELISFLTEIVASQFDSNRPVADRQIGKYIATDIIGRGGYSVVYKGIHSSLNMPVTIKMMRHNMVIDSDFLTCFHNEAKIIAGLHHENIVRVYDIEERFRTIFLIMEYLEGESLHVMLKRLKVIPPLLAADFLFQICAGLEYAHLHGIIHRDINTDNIFVQNNDQIKILDFGLACPAGTDDSFVGAMQYQAPELLDGQPATQKTDLYALGITAFELITGKRPYPEDNPRLLLQSRYEKEIPDPAKLVENMPEELRLFIIKCCRRDSTERFKNVGEAIAQIQPLINRTLTKTTHLFPSQRKTTTLFIRHTENQNQDLANAIDKFKQDLKVFGIDLKLAELRKL